MEYYELYYYVIDTENKTICSNSGHDNVHAFLLWNTLDSKEEKWNSKRYARAISEHDHTDYNELLNDPTTKTTY